MTTFINCSWQVLRLVDDLMQKWMREKSMPPTPISYLLINKLIQSTQWTMVKTLTLTLSMIVNKLVNSDQNQNVWIQLTSDSLNPLFSFDFSTITHSKNRFGCTLHESKKKSLSNQPCLTINILPFCFVDIFPQPADDQCPSHPDP